jgi:cytochrome b subunit of formate dehydrogenase
MKDFIVRFSRKQRAEHVAVMLLFLLLALTGFPQKFHENGWAHTTVSLLGGLDRVRWLHRVAGVLFALLAGVHVATGVLSVLLGKTRFALVPKKQDFVDAIVTLRYYMGLAPEQARFDRFDYRQKFEYWGLLLGGLVMIATGFILLEPILATRILPGELLPASKVAHSNEGLMAFLVVITWHIYNAHLNPDVFPFDTTIFTGKISRERIHHEHPLELERIEAADKPAAGE